MFWEKETPFDDAIAGVPPRDFIEIEGQRVYCQDLGAGPAILMLHGFASSSYSFRFLLEPLSRSHRILTLDLNGFGMTERPAEARAYHHEHQADVIVKVLEKKEVREVVIMGHSYGAVIAGILSEHYPDLVRKLILVCPPAEFAGEAPWYLRGKLGVHLAIFLLRLLLSNPKKFHEISSRAVYRKERLTLNESEVYRKSMLIEGFRQAALGYVATFGNHRAEMIRYEAIEHPTMILAGAQDTVVPPEKIKEVAQRIPSSHAVFIPESGHCPPEEQPDHVITATLEFLEA